MRRVEEVVEVSEHVFPIPPQTVHCPKCNRSVAVSVNIGKPGMENECKEQGCPIASDPDNQPTGSDDGTSISFPEAG